MRVTRSGSAKTGEQKAIDTVVAENGHQETPKDKPIQKPKKSNKK
jgi:hypothetical protein